MDYNQLLSLMREEHILRFGEIFLAGILGGIIGLEREHRGQAAGFRTNMIISVGACLLMQLSIHIELIHSHLGSDSVVRLDPARIASYAISSMGFLGAGAIIKGKGSVRGLTTAASMWLMTGIGLCIGAGVIYAAIAVTLIVMLILYLFPTISKKMIRNRYTKLKLVFEDDTITVKEVKDILYREGLKSVQNKHFKKNLKTNKVTLIFNIVCSEKTCLQDVSSKLYNLPNLSCLFFDEAEVP